MSTMKLTLIGLYNYDPTLFDNLALPAGIDVDVVRNNILMRSGDFEVLYGDPNFIKTMIGMWSKKWNLTFKKWNEAINSIYDPISNYDRKEEWTTDTTGSDANKTTGTNTSSSNANDKVSAFNSNTMVPDKSTDIGSSSTTGTDSAGTHADKEVRKGRAYGNIGVTTSQQMIESSLQLYRWNLYEQIADIFISEFCIPVY